MAQEYLSVPEGQEGPVCEGKTYTVVEDRPMHKERRTLVRLFWLHCRCATHQAVPPPEQDGWAAHDRIAPHELARTFKMW